MTIRTAIKTRTNSARVGLAMALGLLVLASGVQLAQAAPKRLGVVTFRGPGEGATRNAVTKAGKTNHFQVVGGQQISKAASKLKVTLDNNDSFQAVAKELGISAFVTGEVSKKKATLTVRNGADGSVTAEASWTGPNPRKLSAAVGKTFWRRLGSAIDRAKAPSGAKQAVVAQEETAPETGADDAGDDDSGKGKGKGTSGKKVATDDDASSERSRDRSKKTSSSEDSGSENVVAARPEREDESGGSRLPALILGVGPRVVNRAFTLNQNAAGGTRNYKLAAAPELALNLDLFPAAFSSGGFISNVGLTASVAYMLPVVTTPVTGVGTYKTYALDWSLGVKVRFPIGVYGTIAYGDQRYQLIRPANTMADLVPMVDYRYVRIGGGGRFTVTPRLVITANLAYLQVLSFGQIATSTYFPKTTGRGVEVGVGGGYRLTRLLEIQAGVDLRRYGLAFNVPYADFMASPDTVRAAGGAVDQYATVWAGVAMAWGGDSPAAVSTHTDDEEAPAAKSDSDEEKSEDKDDDESSSKSSKKKKKSADDEL